MTRKKRKTVATSDEEAKAIADGELPKQKLDELGDNFMGTKRPRVVEVEEYPARCPRCGSTERTGRDNQLTKHINGKRRDGSAFNQVVWFWATCKGCNQRLKVRSLENV